MLVQSAINLTIPCNLMPCSFGTALKEVPAYCNVKEDSVWNRTMYTLVFI